MKGKDFDFYFREVGIGRLRIYHHVKVKATALGLVKLMHSFLITELECILNDASLSAGEKVEKIRAKISEWDVRDKEKEKEVEGLAELLGKF